jgi:hypothetical protein
VDSASQFGVEVYNTSLQAFLYSYALWGVAEDRCWYRTCQNYLGLGSISTKPGDQVRLLCGAKVPFVLRPQSPLNEGKHELVGGCYLHGFMHGEMLKMPGFKNKITEVCII